MLTVPTEQCNPDDFDPDDLITIDEACAIIGGKSSPISKATFYRGVKRGVYRPPIKIGPNMSRVLRSECQQTVRAATLARDAAPILRPNRGRRPAERDAAREQTAAPIAEASA